MLPLSIAPLRHGHRAPRAAAPRCGPFSRLARVLCLFVAALGIAACAPRAGGDFVEHVVDAQGPVDPWAKGVGDVDGDGVVDIVVGGYKPPTPTVLQRIAVKLGLAVPSNTSGGLLVWYGGIDRQRHVVSDRFNIRTDVEVADLDADGRNDIVAVTNQGLVWFRSPDWAATVIDARVLHDVEVADLDGDGRLDFVARNQHLFGRKDGEWIHFYRQTAPLKWQHAERLIQSGPGPDFGGEGLKVTDLDGDRRPDVLVNQAYLRNPGTMTDLAAWALVRYCTEWTWPHAFLDVADLNADGRPDIVMAPAEPTGLEYRLSWCEAPAKPDAPWVEHVVDARVETVMHGVAVGDLDGDGRLAIVASTMHVAKGPAEVAVYRPQADGAWARMVIGRSGSHSIRLADVDRDGDLDVIGANFSGDDQRVRLWTNQSVSRTAAGWRRHVLDDARSGPAVFVVAGDFDGDGRPDLARGGRWYANPGRADRPWPAHEIGPAAHNVVLAHDFDRDGKTDLLASEWNGTPDGSWRGRLRRWAGLQVDGRPGGMLYARNEGKGQFSVHRTIDAGAGDFPQGAALLRQGDAEHVVVSWHRSGAGLQQFRVPPQPAQAPWTSAVLSSTSQDEQLTAVDLDRDGRQDLVLGSLWLRQPAAGPWQSFALRDPLGTPDRHRVADIDGDGRADVVIGDQAISRPGMLAWYKQGSEAAAPWSEHVIGRFVGPMSLDVADVDHDGDPDVIVGEHDLRHPASARLLWLENRDGRGRLWVPHLIHTGDEHHDGALAIDIDGDGDLDVVSIGWGHGRLLLYENLERQPS